ncbi:hypothetical protein [Gemmata obscuriglobus]|uniref:hypothetical protein n=1 Tax=Gemmata obscuriglobus TaxID=114 RepID=UPI0012FC7105|nr:hypothetical protein [Gemmata obscuriglobus]
MNAVLRVIGWTLAAAVAGAVLVFLGAVAFVELIQPRMFPPKPGEGFNALGLVLYLFGPPCGAVIGATAGLVWSLYRWRRPDRAPANLFGYLFSGLVATGVLCFLLLVVFRGGQVKPLAWLLVGGVTADAVVGAAACFWLGARSTRYAEPGAAPDTAR